MPISRPWNAPEHTRLNQQWTGAQAEKLDIFSYGMLCLWILFHEQLSQGLSVKGKEVSSAGGQSHFSPKNQASATLSKFEESHELPWLLERLLEAEKAMPEDWKRQLSEMLNTLLNVDPSKRDLRPGPLPFDQIPDMKPIEASFSDLYSGDHRVRSYIAKCLQNLYNQSSELSTVESTRKTTFQLALCYKLGFGIKRHEKEAVRILQENDLNQIDLKETLASGKRQGRPHYSELVNNLIEQGHMPTIALASYCEDHQILREAIKTLTQEAEDLSSALGVDNRTTLKVQEDLAMLLRNVGRLNEAAKLGTYVMETHKKILGPQHQRTLFSTNRLASILWDQGRWEELQVVKSLTRRFGPGHGYTLENMYNLAYTYWRQGRWQEAELLDVQILEARNTSLGPEHPDTLLSVSRLIPVYTEQKRWSEAETLLMHLTETSLKYLGPEHEETLGGAARLAEICEHQNKHKDAELIRERLMRPHTLEGMCNLASAYFKQNRFEEVEKLEVLVLEERKKILGVDHPDVLETLTSLSATYIIQSKWKEAEKLNAIGRFRRMLGPGHQDTVSAMHVLALMYNRKGRRQEVTKLIAEILKIKEETLGSNDLDTVRWMSRLAVHYARDMKWSKANKLFGQMTEIRERILGADHPDTLKAMSNMAGCHWESSWNGQKEAKKILDQVLETRKRVMGLEHPDTLDSLQNLALLYSNSKRLREAEELQTQVVDTRKRLLGRTHPSTLTSMMKLAHTLWDRGRQDEAITLMGEAEELTRNNYGDSHPDTIHRSKALEKWKRQRSRNLGFWRTK